MKNLRTFKIFDFILLGFAYLAAIFMSVAFLIDFQTETTTASTALVITSVGIYAFLLFLEIIGYILTIIFGIAAKETLSKHNMIMKIAYIPFFILNILPALGVFVDSASIDLLVSPLILAFIVFVTFVVMFKSSLLNIVYFVTRYIKKELRITPWAFVAFLLSMIFVLDVISGIILYFHERNQSPKIAKKINTKMWKKISRKQLAWNKKKHMNILIYKIVSIASSVVLFVCSIVISLTLLTESIKIITGNLGEDDLLVSFSLLIFPLICLGFAGILKLVIAIIYGKNGEKNPINFTNVIKIIDIAPIVILVITAAILLLISSIMGLFAILFFPFIAVIIVALFVIALIGIGGATYIYGSTLLTTSIFFILGDSLAVFTYYLNQRILKNRRFKNFAVVACMFFLLLPVLDIIGLFVLKVLDRKDAIYGDEPIAIEE